ncbi:MAG: 50S ribosomal protein L25/general stress protein Ctc [Helicobacteraceae bacterium]|jgi:large subunit ribosomal protein L25|nr:50S ribosomal protein L25/general stress protein Ctc [Helicobacteraceae bacterium]
MLEGIVRESIAKSATKALRKDGYLIANIYGGGEPNINAAFKKNDFTRFVKNKEKLVFDVKVGEKKYPVVIEEYQTDPVSGDLLHVDLRIVVKDKLARYLVPIKTIGTPKGLKNKGVFIKMKKRLPVQCLGKDLPNSFDIDVSDLDVNDTVLTRDIKAPKGVKILLDGRIAITGVIKAK